ncbi:MAG: rhodanese-like domain-containing protein [Gammaproteobacteria bacterium]
MAGTMACTGPAAVPAGGNSGSGNPGTESSDESLRVDATAGRSGTQCVSPEPQTYRLDHFLAPTPCTLAGATVVDTHAVRRLLATGATAIDVLPAPRKPSTIGPGELWLPPLRDNIPGSWWLPNTGFGLLPAEEAKYLRDNLELISAGRNDAPMVFYCDAQCWMSWNAARRAVEWGYTSVYWYPGGADAWREAGMGLEAAQPVTRREGQ